MKIKFKSTQFEKEKEVGKVEFSAPLIKENEEDGVISLTFDENREGKTITNRIEYNSDSISIFSGVSSLHCKYNEIIKNDYAVGGKIGSLYLYTKMFEINTSDPNNLLFKYLISAVEDCKDGIIIQLELIISE